MSKANNIKRPVRPPRNVLPAEDLQVEREDKAGLQQWLEEQNSQAAPATPPTPTPTPRAQAKSGSGDELVRLTVRVPASLRQRFKVTMAARNESHTAVFTELLEKWLADNEVLTPAEVRRLQALD